MHRCMGLEHLDCEGWKCSLSDLRPSVLKQVILEVIFNGAQIQWYFTIQRHKVVVMGCAVALDI